MEDTNHIDHNKYRMSWWTYSESFNVEEYVPAMINCCWVQLATATITCNVFYWQVLHEAACLLVHYNIVTKLLQLLWTMNNYRFWKSVASHEHFLDTNLCVAHQDIFSASHCSSFSGLSTSPTIESEQQHIYTTWLVLSEGNRLESGTACQPVKAGVEPVMRYFGKSKYRKRFHQTGRREMYLSVNVM